MADTNTYQAQRRRSTCDCEAYCNKSFMNLVRNVIL